MLVGPAFAVGYASLTSGWEALGECEQKAEWLGEHNTEPQGRGLHCGVRRHLGPEGKLGGASTSGGELGVDFWGAVLQNQKSRSRNSVCNMQSSGFCQLDPLQSESVSTVT